VDWDKGSVTEQQATGTGTAMIQTRRIHNTNSKNGESHSHHPPLPVLPSRKRVPAAPLTPNLKPA